MKKVHLLLMLFMLIASSVAFAQEELTETYVSEDGTISISYPEDWVVTELEDQFIYVGTSEDAIEAVQTNVSMDEDDIVVAVFFPSFMELIGYDIDDDPEAVLTDLLNTFNADGEIEDFDDASVPGARVYFENAFFANGEAMYFALEFDEATLLILSFAGDDFEDSEEIIEAIVASIQYSGEEESQEEESSEDAYTLTPVNIWVRLLISLIIGLYIQVR